MRYQTRLLTAFSLFLLCTLAPSQASAATINFDDSAGSCTFAQALPVGNQFQDLGVTFAVGGAIFDNSCAFYVTGNSGPNILGYNDADGATQFLDGSDVPGSDLMFFSAPLTSVSFLAGIGGTQGVPELIGGSLTANAFDEWGTLLDTTTLELAREMQLMSLSGDGIVEIEYFTTGQPWDLVGEGAFVIDDVTFARPIPEPHAAVLFCIGGLIVGVAARRKVRARS